MEIHYDLDDLRMTRALPIFLPPTPEPPNFFEELPLSDRASLQNVVNVVTGILSKALSTMEKITETGGQMTVDQVVRKLKDELSPILNL